jgi:hypothetical protein
MFSIGAKGYCTGFGSVPVVYRLEAVVYRYVSKDNKATDRIYRVFRRMKDGLRVAINPAGRQQL